MADKTPDSFYKAVFGNSYDVDGVYGAQCVDGFKYFCKWASLPVVATPNNYADGYWYSKDSLGFSSYFHYVTNYKDFRNGDWVIWARGSTYPSSHISMYYNGKMLGQNQHVWNTNGRDGFSLISANFSSSLGALRWKSWGSGSYSDYSEGSALEEDGVPLTIDYSKLKPYIITIDRNTSSNLNFSKLKSNGVVGCMIEGGYLYTSGHTEVDTFRSPKAYSQAEIVSSNKLPHGYYMIARAKNESEAKKEMYEFSFLLRKHAPALGAWIVPAFTSSNKSSNDNIMNTYKFELYRLGLKSKIGIYATQKQLDLINWSKHKNDWILWLNSHISSKSQLQQLLYPEFFDMEGKYT